jgi:hypothetical protein
MRTFTIFEPDIGGALRKPPRMANPLSFHMIFPGCSLFSRLLPKARF